MSLSTFSKKKILIIEDDMELAQWLGDYLVKHGYVCLCEKDGVNGLSAALSDEPDLVILDGMLPGLDGFEVCKRIRQKSSVPILILTARDEEMDEVLGLEIGANDYVIKPVRLRALLTRINKLITGEDYKDSDINVESQVRIGEFFMDNNTRSASVSGEVIELSSKEFDVLYYLAVRAGQVITRESIIKAIRGFDFDGFDRSIDLNISRVRKKISECSQCPVNIKTVWGKGYILIKAISNN